MNMQDETQSSDEGSDAPRGPVLAPIAAGSRIGRYVVIDRVGAGGMGVVYSAYDPQLGRKVALKLLHPQLGRDELGQRRLLREAQAMAQLRHPAVIAVHDAGVDEDRVFVAMEFVDGESMRDWLAASGGRRPWREVVALFQQAAEGLAAAHDAGLVHRDFKPDNVMIDGSGRARVMDFGLARASVGEHTPDSADAVLRTSEDSSHPARARVRARLQALGRIAGRVSGDANTMPASSLAPARAGHPELTRPGAIVGTPAYMAPEQLRGDAVDARADQFAFFVALYEALYARRPFAGDSVLQMMVAVLESRIEPPPREIVVPRWLHSMVVRGLAVKPADRHADMHAVATGLAVGTRRPLRLLTAAVGLAAIAGGIAVVATRDTVCTGAPEALGDAWNEARRGAVRDGLLAIDTPFAEPTSARAIEGLDIYAEQWVGMHEDACLATRVRGEQSEHVLDLRMACLAGRRRALVALADVLTVADESAAERAVEAVAHLPGIAACADVQLDAPELAGTTPEHDRIRTAIAEAEAERLAGHHAAGLERIASVEAEVVALGDLALAAEHEWTRGRLLDEAGRRSESADALRRAAHAARASRHDALAAAAETELVFVTGYRLHALDESRVWGQHARAAVDRIGGDALLLARLANHEGVVLHDAGHHGEALAKLRGALGERERLLGPGNLDVAESHHNVGLACRDQRDLECARTHLEQALAGRLALLGPDHPRVAESLSALAGVTLLEGETERAIATWSEALRIQRGAWGETHPQIANTLNNLGNAAFKHGDPVGAEAYFRGALAIWESTAGPEDTHVDRALHNLGVLLVENGAPDEARAMFERAAAGRERKLGPDHPDLGRTLVQLGLVTIATDRNSAVRVLRRATSILDAADVDPATQARARFGLALALADDPATRAEALRWAAKARDAWLTAKPAQPERIAEIEAFVAQHSGQHGA